jgi:hypothetical protein
MHTPFLFLVALVSVGQAPDREELLAAAHKHAQEFAQWFSDGEYDKMAGRLHPAAVKLIGGPDKAADKMRELLSGLPALGLKVVRYEVFAPKEIHEAGKEVLVFVPTKLRMEKADGLFFVDEHLIASSADGGKTWYFVNAVGEETRKLFPELPKTVVLPPRGRLQEDVANPGLFSHEKANFKLTYPKNWKKLFSPGRDFQLILELGEQVILVGGEESGLPAEDALGQFLSSLKFGDKGSKEHQREKRKVGGAAAILVRLDVDDGKQVKDVWVTLFEYHGITYRVLGVGPKGKAPNLEKDYQAVLDTFSFLGERKEWLAANLGTPARTAFLAGLASLELNRPRWQEISFDEPADPGAIESVRFKRHSGSGWINVSVFDQRSNVKTELEVLTQNFAQRLEKFESKRILIKRAKGGFQAGVEMTGNNGPSGYVILGTVVLKGGLAAHLTLECLAAQRSQMQKDWEQLVREFRLEDSVATPPLFPLRPRDNDRQRPHPVVSSILKKATTIYPFARLNDVHSISADGQHALIVERSECAIENLADRKRTLLAAVQPSFGAQAVWSRDGKQIAYPTHKGVGFHTIGTKTSFQVPHRASSVAFLPDDRLLIAALPSLPEDERYRYRETRFLQQRLLRYEEGEEIKTLLDFPLARMNHLAVSPDGKQLALVTNKDQPRTSARSGNLYLAQPDGSGMRRLTTEAETILSVAWSEDGRWLYVVRRLAHDADARDSQIDYEKYRPNLATGDLYRISPETGAATNLTRSGVIDRVWVQGEHLLLRISSVEVPIAQCGIHKIALKDLEQIAAGLPEPKSQSAAQQARQIADKLKTAYAPKRLQDLVPTPEALDKLARDFAEAAAAVLGEPFDFSAASLDSLPRWADWLEPGLSSEPALVFGFGAYYGETLRKLGQGQWRLEPLRLGDWLPRRNVAGNPMVQVVLPFSEIYRYGSRAGGVFLHTPEQLTRGSGQKLILVFPPATAESALKKATSKGYQRARDALDRGDLKLGLKLLGKELQRYPNNLPLALEALELCEVARMPALADQMAKTAVDAGSDVLELLLRHADVLTKSEPAKALALYQKAAQAPFVSSDVYLKLGKQFATLKQQPLADCCFRRAYTTATGPQRDEIRRLLGMPKQDRFDRFDGP